MNNKFAEYGKLRYGMFVHYVACLTTDKDGKNMGDLQELANAFDVDAFANDLAEMGMEYIILTAYHAMSQPLFPSVAMEKWRPGRSAKRDLMGEVISALKAKNIGVMIYTHPREGFGSTEPEKIATGWGSGADKNGWDPNPETFDFAKWNDYINDVYAEVAQRYGKDILGIWIDEGSPANDSYRVVDYPRLRKTIKDICPDLLTMTNFYGCNYSCDVGMKEYGAGWNEFKNADGSYWPSYTMPVGAVITSEWWASKANTEDVLRFTPEDMFRYMVLQASTNTNIGGGVAWAAGPYPYGQGWEKGIKESLVQVGKYLASAGDSVLHSVPSISYPAVSGVAIKDIDNFVATASPDGKYEYIHVLKAPSGKTLCLPVSENGTKYCCAHLLDGTEVDFMQNDMGITLTISGEWDKLDTVIRLTVSELGAEQAYYIINDTNFAICYVGEWEYDRWERCKGDYEADMHITKDNGAYYSYAFIGSGVDIISNLSPIQGESDVYVDNVFYGTINLNAPEYKAQQVVFSVKGIYTGEHFIRVVKKSGETMELDAIKIYK